MRKSFVWMAILVLVSLGAVVACSTKYSSTVNGLVVVPSRDNQIIQTFSLNLNNGSINEINNPNFPFLPEVLGPVITDPTGNFVFEIVLSAPNLTNSQTGIMSFPIASDGKLGAGATATLNPTSPVVNAPCVTANSTTVPVQVTATPVVPTALVIDSAGKYLFVADSATSGTTQPYMCNGQTVTNTVAVPGTVSVFSVTSGQLTEVPGSPFALPIQQENQVPSASALAVTPTTYPFEYAVCAQQTAISTENLYVTDSIDYVILNYSVNLSTGTLTPIPASDGAPGLPTGSVPSGVAVDPCNRFVYVANAAPSNNVSAYTICSSISMQQNCQVADFHLQPVTGSPYSVGDDPGPISVDAYGNFLYVVNVGSNTISAFRISSASGALAPLSPATYATASAAGQISGSNSIAIRNDDSFLFVANDNTQTVSEFAITAATGGLSPQTPINTFNYPAGVAVK